MKHRLITPGSPSAERTYAVILETGDEFTRCLTHFAHEAGLSASHFTAIGAFSSVVLGYFEWDRKAYKRIPIDEQVEVVALLGDIALGPHDGPVLHPHVTVAKSDGSAWGGHLLEGIVRPTLEILVMDSPASLVRRFDPATGLALLEGDA
ncbi:MAG: DUF296 domain-containing protein [Proteobacteria bacterium]|nr:MAG: DUF296 domain-containing protein [Pseudomonadota bacterium]